MNPKAFRSFVMAILLVVMMGAAAYYLLGDTSDPETLSFDRSGPRMVALSALLAVLLVSLFHSGPRIGEVLRALIIWGGLGLILVTGYTFRTEFEILGRRLIAALIPGTAIEQTDGSVVVLRDGGRHYRIRAKVNGADAVFLVDTGASAVTLTADDARAAGFDLDRLSYTIPVSTANGRTFVAPVEIEGLDIGTIHLSDTRAYVSRDGALEVSLLGLSALDRLSSWRVEGNRLILNP
ncbi:TIGR02281 family clan AA aspartic protease [Rhizobiales bacterium]|uniref:retropepsin-like aspartic protease family protein n=1 Tax=Hongsoonwoonella zoysiae TaxID=2821844 RepID=UPI001560CD6B|nr:TIGR02281 family clan AA aspartic protease [Hongsoonwoonella zoysiae]NRG18329.1 TIGR02281 family clan AA aspartic protease [Hongsoonwoonella zoysiae]